MKAGSAVPTSAGSGASLRGGARRCSLRQGRSCRLTALATDAFAARTFPVVDPLFVAVDATFLAVLLSAVLAIILTILLPAVLAIVVAPRPLLSTLVGLPLAIRRRSVAPDTVALAEARPPGAGPEKLGC